MHTCLVVLSVLFAVPAAWRPVGVEQAIKKANRVAAEATATWTRFDPKSVEYESAIETVKQSGVFEHPVEVPVSNISFKVDPQTGAIALDGIYQGVDRDLGKYFTRDEFKPIEDFDSKTKTLDADFRRNLERQRDKREIGIDHNHPRSGERRQLAYIELEQWTARKQKKHRAQMKTRATERKRLMADLGASAEERQRNLGFVRIKTTIPPALASTIDMPKLKTKKKALLTIQVRTFGLREGNDEIDYAVGIGNLSGETIAITMKR